MSRLNIILVCVLLSGCTSIQIWDGKSDFKSLIGKKTLLHDGLVCIGKPRKKVQTPNQIVWQNKNENCYIGDTLMKVKKGDSVIVTNVVEVKSLNLFQFQHWYLIGYIPYQNEEVPFYFYWALTTTSPDYPERVHTPKWK